MLLSVSPGATIGVPDGATSAVRGGPTGAGSGGAVGATRLCGATAATDERYRGITRCWPGCTAAGVGMPFASISAETGTPWARAIVSRVSPGPTVMGVPPSQVQTGCGGAARIE